MAKNQGLNTIQTYVFWNLHEQKQGVLDFSGRANLSKFLQDAADAGLFVNLRIGPFVCAEWNYGGLPVWLNQVPNIVFRSSNPAWEATMKNFILEIIDYVTPYLAKNGGPIILAQIENEYRGNDQAYIDWCGSLVTNELAPTQIPWIMCGGLAANSTIETCNSCNCYRDDWMNYHTQHFPDKPILFTENEGWFHAWGDAVAIRTPTDLALSVVQWFAAGGAYHAYYMWHGGNNYGRTPGSGITTMYADDVCLHADGTPNEPKYTHLSRLQHLLADHAQALVSQDPNRTALPWWDGKEWVIGTQHGSVRIYDDNVNNLLWDYTNYTDINGDNTEIFPIVIGPLKWQTWSEPDISKVPIITSSNPIEQLKITNDETVYLWYRRNVTLTQAEANTIFRVETRRANALLFFLDEQYLGEFDNHDHSQGGITAIVALDLSTFKVNQQYSFEILSISLGLDNDIWAVGDTANQWQHQKGLAGEYYQIYTEQGSSKVDWNTQWTKGIDKPVTWFQARFDLDHLVREDTNANPVLLDAQGLNRGHAFINGNDLGIYWLIEGTCHDGPPCCCRQAQINCMKPTQRYYHIPSDWLMPQNNLITIFDEVGAHSPGSVGLVQRVIIA